MQIVIDISNAPIKDYQDLYYKIHGMAASEGLFDDKEKSQRALALKAVLDILGGIVDGTPLPKGHGDLIDRSKIYKAIPAEEDNCIGMGMTFEEMDAYNDGIDAMYSLVQGKLAIIEADKKSEDKE